MAKLKYLIIFIVPISAMWSFFSNDWQTFLPVIIAFIVVPTLELFLKPDHNNLDKVSREMAEKSWFYSVVLYTILPIQLIALYFFLTTWNQEYSPVEIIGRITSMGVMCGVFGINVGHELGHRDHRFEQFIGELLLLTSLETHFLIYHNYGHHFDVATRKDPATARKNEWLYSFWIRSQFGSYVKAWQLQTKLLKIKKVSFLSLDNRMLWYTIFQISMCIAIYLLFGMNVLLYFLVAAIFGILLLETVNYIEHYGLWRKQKKSGRFEVVNPMHSWNSDHVVGRLLLFELSRHSDHHHRANKPYQILDSHPDSPQMITGYPGMMLLALIPPLWFKIMNNRIPS
ncbi:MAG: alkane 1-monooxygenase [Bacteroidetes bacterium MedPE-SWsnd-G1]|nr:MAG: alkane 1-monooxygenase [Bacteroidetes bacterium MedPE-SWsnd-G1]OIQ37055.1 MAG: alkane 1-monooxygenase [Bacteroidetes bacterium MedPE-SWsnd-G1]